MKIDAPSIAFNEHRAEIRRIVSQHNASHPRVFGSVARGDDTVDSDLDLLVDPGPDMTLFDVGAIMHQVSKLVGVRVDLVTSRQLQGPIGARILAEATPV